VVLDKDAGSWFIVDSSNTVIVSVMVEEKGRQTADKKEGRKPWTLREFGGQTVWDWLHLLSALAIPVVLAAAGLWFTAQQDQRQQEIEGQRAKQAQKIEDQRAAAERELAEQRAQDEALQAYLDQMSQLMLERKLLEAEPGDPVHTLAQARTSTAILRLDAQHNESVTHFLIDSRLAVSGETSARLLSEMALSEASLSSAQLAYADLSDADLTRANLSRAYLFHANLSDAQGISNEALEQQAFSLKSATMPNGQKYEDRLKSRGEENNGS
jgi:multidrug efflux pump subunit AcrA (membrane-fusion protein)